MGQSGGFAKRPGGGSLVQLHEAESSRGKIGGGTLVQALDGGAGGGAGAGGPEARSGAIHEAAAHGISGGGGALPHLAAIQQSFGHHDVSGVSAHVGGPAQAATQAMGAEAYATGSHVAFAGAPSLHTAAHEAAHVVQQRGGIQLKGGVGAAGDPHEQHADAVADAVVQGGSAEALLDQYTPGSESTPGSQSTPGSESATGGDVAAGGAVQRQEAPPTPQPASAPDVQAIIARLDGIEAIAIDVANPSFDIDAVTAWMTAFHGALAEAKAAAAAAGAAPPAELTAAVDRCATAHGPALGRAAAAVRDATIAAANDSSVALATPAAATFPTQAQAKRLAAAAGTLSALQRDPALPATAPGKAALHAGVGTAQDAALAVMQALSVAGARERWNKGTSTETPAGADAGKGARTELDEIFNDAGFGSRTATYLPEGKTEADRRVFDWCGMFVVSSMFKGGGLAQQLRAGFYHTNNVDDFFHYVYARNPERIPRSIWAEGQWWGLQAYHQARGSVRMWTPRAAIQAALAGGGAADIRPGDTCLIDHGGGNAPSHIVMVESYDAATHRLVTIEGNTYGIHADATGKAERLDDDHLKRSSRGAGTAAGVHVRELRTLAPGPGEYVVNTADAAVRLDENLTKFKLEGGKKVLIPEGSSVTVTELRDAGGVKYANVDGWGWTRFSNLGVSAKPPAGGYQAVGGATVWGVGRPSVVDFEDGHEYAVRDVPATLTTTSPDQMRELAKYKGKDQAQVKLAADARKAELK